MEQAKVNKKSREPLMQRLGTSTKKMFVSGGALILLFLLFTLMKPGVFLQGDNLINIVHQVVSYAIVGFGMTYVLVCGGTDLSAGASLALAGIVVVWLLQAGTPLWICLILGVVVGIIMGFINGFSIMILGVVPFIATLGTQWVFRGLANVFVNGRPIYTNEIPSTQVQNTFYFLGGGRIFGGIPFSVVIMLIYGAILFFILAKTPVGRKIYACGSNMEAARLSGINVIRTRIFAYCVSGVSAAIAGILMASRISTAMPASGQGYELEAIAASVLGGVSNTGGEGGINNTIIGALIMGVLRNGLNLCGVNTFYQQVVIGIIIVAACAVEAYRNRKYA
ncbi:ABC transporter permease [Anaerolentibacter hominis]|uniref:ABC transporter permease n=1 Tax=Anaerolentibacter hominis TaxID=3079009 RepID=UPI0031B856AF